MRAAAFSALFAMLLVPALARGDGPAAGAPAAVALNPAERGWVERVQLALDAITTLKAHFVQDAPDGHITQGTVWLDRPGRMRFQYDKPSPLLLVASGGKVVFNDSQLKQTTSLPLDKTPLGLLLRPHVTLSGDVTLTSFSHEGGEIRLTLQRSATPGDGSLTLIFSDQPLALRSWSVIDAQGRETRVDLSSVALGGSFPPRLFDTDIGRQE